MTDGTQTPPQFEELQNIRSGLNTQHPKQRPTLLVGLIVIAVVLLVIAAIIQIYTPKTLVVPQTSFVSTNSNNTIPNLRKVSYTGPTPDFPNQFSIFSASLVVSETQMIQDLSAKYGLLRVNPTSNIWTNGALSLFKDTSANHFVLTLKDLRNESLPIVNPTTSEQVATSYLRETFPQIQLRPLMDQATYFVLALEIESNTSSDKATGMNIPFTQVLETEEFPVIFEKADQPLFFVTMDGNNTVRLVTFYSQFQNYVKVDTKAPISVEQALDQIQNGVGSILSASTVEVNRVKMSDLTSAILTAVTVEYRLDPQSSLLYPFYKFSGTATSANNVAADIQVITPAIQTGSQTR